MASRKHDPAVAQFKDVFSLFDASGVGELRTGDIGALLRRMGHEFTDAELFKLVHGVVGDVVGETIGNETVLS